MDIVPFLRQMVEKEASDLFLSAGAPATMRLYGHSVALSKEPLQPSEILEVANSLMDAEQAREFERELEQNVGVSIEGVGRFRVNIYRQRGEIALVIRYVKSRIPSLAQLKMPELLQDLVLASRGLILVVGATGSGKSTTLASMLDYRNTHCDGHILTIEEPVEFIHQHKKSIVDQREVGVDTRSYANALKNAMREAPDVIFIGEIRDRETMQQAIAYADTGHLCLSTLHASNANQAIDRIINFFPDSAHQQLLKDLSLNLRAVISQRLVPSLDGKRVPAVEIMLNSPYVADLIAAGKVAEIKEAVEKAEIDGMCSFDQSLYHLVKKGLIGEAEALANADSPHNISVRLRLDRGVESSSTMTMRDADM